jgi:hypothetical protein
VAPVCVEYHSLTFVLKTHRGENYGAQLLRPIYEIKIKHEFLHHIIAFLYFVMMVITIYAASLFRFHSPPKKLMDGSDYTLRITFTYSEVG